MDRQYIITERAHLMCPNMEFGILCSIDCKYDFAKVKHTISKLSEAHPFLKSIICNDENNRPFYLYKECLEIECNEMPLLELVKEDYQTSLQRGWNVYDEALMRVLTYKKNGGFEILFIAHHLLCDGRGLMELAKEFADCYVKGISPTYVEESLIQSLDDFTAGSDLPWISKMVVNSANKHWKKENQVVKYKDYLLFETDYLKKNDTEIEFKTQERCVLEKWMQLCHENGISINDYLVAKMMREESTNKVVIAADIRDSIKKYKTGSLGNFSTAVGIQCNTKSKDIIDIAKMVSTKVKQKLKSSKKQMLVLSCYLRMTPELIDAVPIATLGDLSSEAGYFVGSKMFGYKDRNGYSITNLGKFQSETVAEATFIPPASPANKKTMGVVTVNGIMNTCTVTAVD